MSKSAGKARSKEKSLKKRAKQLLEEADNILEEVDEAQIFKESPPRQFPLFKRSELTFGKVLGIGGYCLVREIKSIHLKQEPHSSITNHDDILTEPSPADAEREEEHYEMSTARQRMEKFCLREGEARYAVKQLHSDLTELERARGMIDLAIEAKYLSAISHPNIIKMRSVAALGPMHKGFFLLLDRLYGTLEERIQEWKKEKNSYTRFVFVVGANKIGLRQLRIERLLVAYDLAAAFRYLHEHKLVYRDIKAENVGFDVRGDVKVFDFGLAKSLHPKLRIDDSDLYNLTPRTGSFPYMAPEVAMGKPYNASADVFSFGMLLYEIMNLELPFEGFSRREYYIKITRQGLRPPIHSSWPPRTSLMMKQAWNKNPKERPDFQQIASLIRADLGTLTTDPEVVERTKHMKQRSLRSLHHRGADAVRRRGGNQRPTETQHGVSDIGTDDTEEAELKDPPVQDLKADTDSERLAGLTV